MAKVVYYDESGGEYSVPLGPESPVVTVGRATDCQIRSGRKSVSRRHAEFYHINGQYEVVDLNSSNGTYLIINQERQQVTTSALLTDGDEVWCGDFVLHFYEETDERADATHAEGMGYATRPAAENWVTEPPHWQQEGQPHWDASDRPAPRASGPHLGTEGSASFGGDNPQLERYGANYDAAFNEGVSSYRGDDEPTGRRDFRESAEYPSAATPDERDSYFDGGYRSSGVEDRGGSANGSTHLRELEELRNELEEVQGQKQQLEDQVSTQQFELNTAREALQSAQQRAQSSEDKVESLRRKLQELERGQALRQEEEHVIREREAQWSEERQNLQTTLQAAQAELQAVLLEKEALASECDTLQEAAERGQEAEIALQSLRREVERQQRLIEEVEARKADESAEIERLENELHEALTRLVRETEAVENFRRLASTREQRIESLEGDLERLAERAREAEQERANLDEQLAKANGARQDLQKELEQEKQRVADSEDKQHRAQQEILELTEKLSAAEQQGRDLGFEIEGLKRLLRAERERADQAAASKSTSTASQHEYDILQAENEELRAVKTELESRLAELEIAHLEQTQALDEARQTMEAQKQSVSTVQNSEDAPPTFAETPAPGDLQERDDEIRRLEAALETAGDEIESLRATNADLEQRLESIGSEPGESPEPTPSAAQAPEPLPQPALDASGASSSVDVDAILSRLKRIEDVMVALERSDLKPLSTVDRLRIQASMRQASPRAMVDEVRELLETPQMTVEADPASEQPPQPPADVQGQDKPTPEQGSEAKEATGEATQHSPETDEREDLDAPAAEPQQPSAGEADSLEVKSEDFEPSEVDDAHPMAFGDEPTQISAGMRSQPAAPLTQAPSSESDDAPETEESQPSSTASERDESDADPSNIDEANPSQ